MRQRPKLESFMSVLFKHIMVHKARNWRKTKEIIQKCLLQNKTETEWSYTFHQVAYSICLALGQIQGKLTRTPCCSRSPSAAACRRMRKFSSTPAANWMVMKWKLHNVSLSLSGFKHVHMAKRCSIFPFSVLKNNSQNVIYRLYLLCCIIFSHRHCEFY